MKKVPFITSFLTFAFSNKHKYDVLSGENEPTKTIFQSFINLQTTESKKEKIKEKAFDKSWEILKFETENYWKRAAYFWAFQIAAFAGYFTILGSDKFKSNTITYALYFNICVGFVTALAWVFINKGSKEWQNHWVSHIMTLEDEITGPLLRVEKKQRISVTNINEIVSWFFTTIWIVLAIEYFSENITFKYTKFNNVDWPVILSSISTIYFVCALYFGYGRPYPLEEKKVIIPESEESKIKEPISISVQ